MPDRLRQWAAGLWTLEGQPIQFLGFPYELRMAIVRLDDGSLWLHSPVQCSDEAAAVVNSLGRVGHLVTPNKLHHLFLGDWARRYPEAVLHAPPGLTSKRRDLHFATTLGDEPEPAWKGLIEQCVFGPSLFMDEVEFFHGPSRTLVVGDLIENHDPRLFRGWRQTIARINRMLGPRAETPRNWRITFRDRRAVRAVAERLLAWRPERVIVMHGFCVDDDAEGFLRHALAWALDHAR